MLQLLQPRTSSQLNTWGHTHTSRSRLVAAEILAAATGLELARLQSIDKASSAEGRLSETIVVFPFKKRHVLCSCPSTYLLHKHDVFCYTSHIYLQSLFYYSFILSTCALSLVEQERYFALIPYIFVHQTSLCAEFALRSGTARGEFRQTSYPPQKKTVKKNYKVRYPRCFQK